MTKPTKADPAAPAGERDASHPGWWTVLAVMATAWLGVPLFLPVAAALPWIVFRWRRRGGEERLGPTIRWALAVWMTGVAMSALAGDRAVRSTPFGPESAVAVRAWLDGSGGAAPTWIAMGAWTVLCAAAAIPFRGAVAGVILAHALLISAIQATIVWAHSSNLVHAGVVALPVWFALLLAGLVVLLHALTAWGESRAGGGATSRRFPRKALVVGGGLLALSFVTRLLLAGPLTDVVRRATIF